MAVDVSTMSTEELRALVEYIDHFNIHYDLLVRRYEYFKTIDDVETTLETSTFFDMVVVQLRAICIESPHLKKNYTAQILLRKLGYEDAAAKIDDMLAMPFIEGFGNLTVRNALKTLADGFICHYDNFDGESKEGWAIAAIIEKQLRNPFVTPNLTTIMNTLIECVGEGISIQ